MSELISDAEFHALCRTDLPTFLQKGFGIVNPGKTFKLNWHHSAIAHQLSRIGQGESRRLIINVCPRSAKSTFASVIWVAFQLGHDPTLTFMCVSHNKALATHHAHAFRKVVSSPWYKKVFPHMSVKPDTDNETTFRTTEGGGRLAVSVESGVTGLGADIILIDDPITTDTATNPAACINVNDWISKTLMTRLNDKKTGRVVLIMQRVSIHDATAHLLQIEPWDQLCLPVRAEQDTQVALYDGDTYDWKKGELLHPEFFSEAEYASQHKHLGAASFSAQYLQRPRPEGGGNIDLTKFGRYTALPKHYDKIIMSVDPASGMNSGSRSAVQIWRYSDGKLYLQAAGCEHWAFPDLLDIVKSAKERFEVDWIVAERTSNGYALLQSLQTIYPPHDHRELLQPITVSQCKQARMARALTMIHDGRVLLPKSATFLASLEYELTCFPKGQYDDQVDALSQIINALLEHEKPSSEIKVTILRA